LSAVVGKRLREILKIELSQLKRNFDAKTLAARRRKVFLEKEIEKIHFSITSSRRQRLCVKNSPSF